MYTLRYPVCSVVIAGQRRTGYLTSTEQKSGRPPGVASPSVPLLSSRAKLPSHKAGNASAKYSSAKLSEASPEEFKRDAIALVDSAGKTVTAVAREPGISSETPRGWYRRARGAQAAAEGSPRTAA
ncbi:transposase [Streptomyces sp. NPDC002588]|uniref:transposase n=1 Tax=Streptomyces sp. NPDC002588 TaxID=3154419 RepID=UPI003331BEF1